MVGQPLDQGSHREAHRPAEVQQLTWGHRRNGPPFRPRVRTISSAHVSYPEPRHGGPPSPPMQVFLLDTFSVQQEQQISSRCQRVQGGAACGFRSLSRRNSRRPLRPYFSWSLS
jgi:hypothetical protein